MPLWGLCWLRTLTEQTRQSPSAARTRREPSADQAPALLAPHLRQARIRQDRRDGVHPSPPDSSPW